MLDPLSAATLPEAPIGRLAVVAAPAGLTTAASATNALIPPPSNGTQRRRVVWWLVDVCISVFLFLFPWCADSWVACATYSLRRASIGASAAARLAG